MGNPTASSEFPHDNPKISAGTAWICPDLTGPASPLLPRHEPVATPRFVLCFDDGEDEGIDAPLELRLADGVVAVQVSVPEPPDPTPPALRHFEAALTSALMAQGASRSAALVPRMLRLQPLPADALGKDAQLTLQCRGYLDESLRYSEKYRELCGAWCAILGGASQDFSACGTTTLDRFGAELLAALLAVPATRTDELRRELRKSGIAAFGVLLEAA